MYRISWLALAAALGALAPTHAYAQTGDPRAGLQLKGAAGNLGVGAGMFVPFVLDNGTVVFADGWLDYESDGVVSGSVGGGVRHQFGDFVLGANGYLDMLHSRRGQTYSQIALGLEALGRDWEFRLNGYLPVGDTSHAMGDLSRASVANGRLIVNKGYEVALYGVDAEVGVRLPVFEADSAATWKAYMGVFAHGSSLTPTVGGISLRTEFSMPLEQQVLPGASLALGGGLRYDTNQQLSAAAYVKLSIPLGGDSQATDAPNPLFQDVARDRTINLAAGAFGPAEAAFARNGSDRVLQVSASDGATSQVNALIAAAGNGAVILASGDILVDQTLALASNQMLVGGGGVLEVRTADGKPVMFQNPGAATTLRAQIVKSPATGLLAVPVAPDVLRLADGSTVSTLSIVGGNNAIVATRVGNVTIDRVNISDVAANGIVLDNVKGATVSNGSIMRTPICDSGSNCGYMISRPDQVPHAAINAVGSSDLVLRNLRISDATYGIFASADIETRNWSNVLAAPATNIRIENVSITNTRQEAFMAVSASNVRIDGLHIDNTGMKLSKDLAVFMSSSDVVLANSSFKGGINALMFAHYFGMPTPKPQNITVSNVDIANTSRSGIFINPSENVTFRNVRVAAAGEYGVHFHADGSGFNGGPIKGVSFDGFTIDGAKSAVHLAGPLQNVAGNIVTRNVGDPCDALTQSWAKTAITQDPGVTFSVDGQVLDNTTLTRC